MPGKPNAARRVRALEARMAQAFDQILQDHAEWRRLIAPPEEPGKNAKPPVSAPTPQKAARKPAVRAAAKAAAPAEKPMRARTVKAAPPAAAPPAKPKAPTRAKRAKKAASAPPRAREERPATRPQKAARKAAVKRKKQSTAASPQMMRNLKEAQRKLEALGVKPYAPKKPKLGKEGNR